MSLSCFRSGCIQKYIQLFIDGPNCLEIVSMMPDVQVCLIDALVGLIC